MIFEALLLLYKDNLEADEILLSDKLSDLKSRKSWGRDFIINLTSRIETLLMLLSGSILLSKKQFYGNVFMLLLKLSMMQITTG